MLIFWIAVFIISLTLLVKSADWLLFSAEKIGLKMGLSPFVVGITIIAFGTSFPELVSSLFAVFEGLTEVVTANVVGSNIANILLVVGLSAFVGKRLSVTKDLIDLDLPLVALATSLFVFTAYDGTINIVESIFLLVVYGAYLAFSITQKDEQKEIKLDINEDVKKYDYVILVVGMIGLAVGANYLIESIIILSTILDLAPGVITITAVAIGTSLPELLVSLKAAVRGNSEVALGNIFGSNIFNVLVVIGLPGLFTSLSVDEKTLSLGIPVMVMATVLFIFSGISRRIHIQEGIFYVTIYIFFIAKLFGLF